MVKKIGILKTAYHNSIGATKTKHKQTPLRRRVKNGQSMRWPEVHYGFAGVLESAVVNGV